jgi:hypothetical protein
VANSTEQQSLLAWKQRVAAAEAVEKATESVKQEEKGFAKGAAIGAVGSLAVGAAGLAGMVTPGVSGGELANDTRNFIEDKLIDPQARGEATGFDAGMVGGDAAQMITPMMGTKATIAGIKGIAKMDEMTQLEIQQAQDLLFDLKRGGGENKLIRESLSKLDGFLQEKGINLKELFPSKPGERNQTGFPAKPADKVYDSEGKLVGNKNKAAHKHSQAQTNPGATSGLEPQGFSSVGDTWENHGIYAARVTETWQKGFNPEQFIRHTISERSQQARLAAKGSSKGPPQFWLWDEEAKKVMVVKRKPDGSLYVGPDPGNKIDAFKRYEEGEKKGKVIRDDKGQPVLRDEIDMVVDSNGLDWIRKKMGEAADTLLESK